MLECGVAAFSQDETLSAYFQDTAGSYYGLRASHVDSLYITVHNVLELGVSCDSETIWASLTCDEACEGYQLEHRTRGRAQLCRPCAPDSS